MTSQRYMLIKTTDDQTGKKFRVVFPNMQPIREKVQASYKTIGGKRDIYQGPIYRAIQVMFKVRETEDETGYGDKEDLRNIYDRNTPVGSRLIITDNYGETYDAYWMGPWQEIPWTSVLEGHNAWFSVNAYFEIDID
jgi:hypothetical protein